VMCEFFRNMSVAFIKPIAAEASWRQSAPAVAPYVNVMNPTY
jgi:hypothetical protein